MVDQAKSMPVANLRSPMIEALVGKYLKLACQRHVCC
jgi:hypothetical protein